MDNKNVLERIFIGFDFSLVTSPDLARFFLLTRSVIPKRFVYWEHQNQTEYMTLEQLEKRMDVVRGLGNNCFVVTITYRGKKYTHTSDNDLAWEAIDNLWENPRTPFYTKKQALQTFYNECKFYNHLMSAEAFVNTLR